MQPYLRFPDALIETDRGMTHSALARDPPLLLCLGGSRPLQLSHNPGWKLSTPYVRDGFSLPTRLHASEDRTRWIDERSSLRLAHEALRSQSVPRTVLIQPELPAGAHESDVGSIGSRSALLGPPRVIGNLGTGT